MTPAMFRLGMGFFLGLSALAALRLALGDTVETTGLRRGDFPAFWSMAVIAAGQEPQRLYDLDLQRQVQNVAWPSLAGSVLPAAYPPQVAFVLQPLAALDHRAARWVWTIVNLAAAILAVRLFVRINPLICWPPWMIFGVMCLFSPILRGVVGGQIVSFGMCLFALVVTLQRRYCGWTEVWLGCVLGIWLFKPYYALCAAIVSLWQRRWAAMVSFIAVGGLCWGVSYELVGPEWFVKWLAFARYFSLINMDTNAHQMPNVWAQVYRLKDSADLFGVSLWIVSVCFYGVLAAGVSALLGKDAIRALLLSPRQNGDLLLHLVLSLVVMVMPQVNFYDLGLMACSVLSLLRPDRRSDRMYVLFCILLSQIGVNPPFGMPVHFVLGVSGLVYVCIRIRESAQARCVYSLK